MNNSSYSSVFKRVEQKYLLTEEVYEALLERISPFIEQDEYGVYTISNIYYDTQENDIIRKSIEKPRYKEKLRLRSYGVPDYESTVFLEIKKKYNGTVFKRREAMRLYEVEGFLKTGTSPKAMSQIFKELDYFVCFYNPIPKLYLAYDREAYSAIDNRSLRITFDKNIRSRTTDLDLSLGDYGEYLFPCDYRLMEIKASCAMPLWLVRSLSELKIYTVSFSKYGDIYTKQILKNQRSKLCSQVY